MEADNLVKGAEPDISLHLSRPEQQAIIAFLQTLTDRDFVTNKAFANPFLESPSDD
jgi:hypothetical protein